MRKLQPASAQSTRQQRQTHGIIVARVKTRGSGRRRRRRRRRASSARAASTERDDVGDLLGRAEPAERQLARDERGDAVGIGLLPPLPAAAGEQDRAGRDRVDADVVAREIARHRLGERDLGGLGDVVAGRAAGLAAPDRRDHDDGAAAARAQLRASTRARAAERRPQVAIERGGEIGVVDVVEVAALAGGAWSVTVLLHTDNVGAKATNESIGLERAEAVKRYLYEQYQIPLHKMNVISYGEDKPVAPNKTKAGRAQNRRVVIKVLA